MVKYRFRFVGFSVLLVLFLTVDLFAQLSSDLRYELSVDSVRFYPHEPLSISVTAYNDTSGPIDLLFADTNQFNYQMDGVFETPRGAFFVPTGVTVPANGSFEWSRFHEWSQYDLALGLHTARGEIVNHWPGYDVLSGDPSSGDVPFTIVPPPPVTSDVLIDFDTFPDGTQASNSVGVRLNAYATWGVLFGSDDPGRPRANGLSYSGTFLSDNVRTSSTGFNIFAEFDMDVMDVSVDVSTSAGTTVTMTAFDTAGNVVGSATSDPLGSPTDFVPLSLTASSPIRRVEWRPSNILAGVQIDNLRLSVVPEPAVGSLLGLAVGLFVLGRRKRK
jgi:hypothetical protein